MCDVWQICASEWLRKHAASSSISYKRCHLQLLLFVISIILDYEVCFFNVGVDVGYDDPLLYFVS